MQDYQVDVLSLTKLHMAWDLLPYEACLPANMWGWWEASHWSRATTNKTNLAVNFNQVEQLSWCSIKQPDQVMISWVLASGAGLGFGAKTTISSESCHYITHAKPTAI